MRRRLNSVTPAISNYKKHSLVIVEDFNNGYLKKMILQIIFGGFYLINIFVYLFEESTSAFNVICRIPVDLLLANGICSTLV